MTTLATVIGKGAIGSRPAAASAGRLYFSTEPKTYRDNGSSWDDVSDSGSGLSDPMTTRGDIIIRNASNVTARLAIGSSGKVLSTDGTDVSWQTPTAAAITTVDGGATADVSVAADAAYHSICSISLTVGTWDIWGWLCAGSTANIAATSGFIEYAQLYNSTDASVIGTEAFAIPAAAGVTGIRYATIPVFAGAVVLGGTKTIQLRCYCDSAVTAVGSTSFGTNGGTRLHAMKIA